jgi:putative ABC transport system ATP-binding protein
VIEQTANNVLETCVVTKTYQVDNNTIKAVDGVSITIEAGEFTAIVGPSGSGKTTLLAMLAGLLTPSEGGIVINGQNLTQMNERELTKFRRENVGFTFQASNLVPYLTVQENVELMLKLNGKLDRTGKARAKALLTKLGLGDRLKNLPSQLSGGQQQRVAIARALIHNPDIVLADEPTASLDTERAFQVVETFAGLIHDQRLAGVMVTHDLRMTEYVDKIIQMQDGQVKQVITDKDEIHTFAGSQN